MGNLNPKTNIPMTTAAQTPPQPDRPPGLSTVDSTF